MAYAGPQFTPSLFILWVLVFFIFRPKETFVSVRGDMLAWARKTFPGFDPTFALYGDKEQGRSRI
ncbi:hypothetical protein D3C72_2420130 [compost metagenome]